MYDVSVIIPNYNGEKFIKEAIDSVLNQAGVNVEVIVVDDGSTDNSKSLLEAYDDRIKVFFQKNKGAPAARNFGLSQSSADFIKFLDSDDVLLQNILQLQLSLFDNLNEFEIPYGQALWTDENLEPISGYPIKPKQRDEDAVSHILSQNPLTSSPLHRKQFLKSINGFDEDLVKGQEFDLHLRLVLNGVNFVYFDHSVYYFRQHASISRFSNKPLTEKSEPLYKMLIKQQDYIADYYSYKIPEDVKLKLAKRSWNFGRALLRENSISDGKLFFKNALRLSNNTMDNRLYFRFLKFFLGNIKTEFLLNKIKSLYNSVINN